MPLPTDSGLYEEARSFIMSKYKKNSAFASGAIVKHYKGLFKKKYGENTPPYSDDNKPKNLKRWFQEKWVDVNPLLGIKDDKAYPVFRPTKKINENTPTLYQEIDKKELLTKSKLKQKLRGERNLPTFEPKSVERGGKLQASTFKKLLKASYDEKIENVDGFKQDKSLSTKTSKVYYNPETGQAVVAHKGTSGISDWYNNAVFAFGGEDAYKKTDRYKEAEKVQREASKKYGNISTIGHSQGGLQAEMLGGDSNEIITLNKATRPFSNKRKENQYDVRTSRDIISMLNPFQPKNNNEIIIKSDSYNPLKEHDISSLERLEGDMMIGRSVFKPRKKIGGMIVRSFPERKENGGII
jgi:hypothetical protein